MLTEFCRRRLTEIKAAILAEPKRIHTHQLIGVSHSSIRFEHMSPPSCGTTGCIAGWALALECEKPTDVYGMLGAKPSSGHAGHAGHAGLLNYTSDPQQEAMDLLGLNEYQAGSLFFVGSWPPVYQLRIYDAVTGSPDYAIVVADRIQAFIDSNGAA